MPSLINYQKYQPNRKDHWDNAWWNWCKISVQCNSSCMTITWQADDYDWDEINKSITYVF